jgi:hypothetical protein
MAQRQITLMTDDLDGSEATQTVSFALDGQPLEIDLNDEHAEQLRETLADWAQYARKAGASQKTAASRARATRSSSAASTEPDPGQVRQWAESNGYEVSARGRIARKIMDAYHAAVG